MRRWRIIKKFIKFFLPTLLLPFIVSMVRADNIYVSSPEDTFTLPTPTPTPIIPQCQLNKLSYVTTGWFGLPEQIYQPGDTNVPACVATTIDTTIQECREFLDREQAEISRRIYERKHQDCLNRFSWWWGYYNDCEAIARQSAEENGSGNLLDDCVIDRLFGFHPEFRTDRDFANKWELHPWAQKAILRGYRYRRQNLTYLHYYNSWYHEGELYLDASCNAVNRPAGHVTDICDAGELKLMMSHCPISLLLDDKVDIDSNLTAVNFPLEPGDKNRWYLWKASASAPLLVFDPQQEGKITQAEQLFGAWTFGGKKLAVNTSSISESKTLTQTAWNDGYEALGSLDINQDKEISGAELAPLALWFDNNRNGISEPGEVRSMPDIGITKLFYASNRIDAGTGSIWADRGFERKVNGEVTVGRSVDWKTFSANTQAELISRHLLQGLRFNSFIPNFSETITGNLTIKEQQMKSEKHLASQLIGFWKWKSQGGVSGEKSLGGYLSFRIVDGNKIIGRSISTLSVNEQGIDTMLTTRSLHGQVLSTTNGLLKVKFAIETENGSRIETVAELNEEFSKLEGTTIAQVAYGTKPLDVTYSWQAERM